MAYEKQLVYESEKTMLTTQGARGAMLESLRDPHAFCDRFDIHPNQPQSLLMAKFTVKRPIIDIAGGDLANMWRATAVCLLWRMLAEPHARAFIVGPGPEYGRAMMEWLKQLVNSDAAIASVVRWQSWTTMMMATDPLNAIRYIDCHSSDLRGIPDAPVTYVMLDGSLEMHDALRIVEGRSTNPGTKIIRFW